MHAQIHTIAFRGIETIDVTVQIHIANGLPAMAIVGLADKAVAESRERVRAALSSIGLALPPKRIAVDLAPADVLKKDAHFDLPIALGLMVAMG
ncbi:MAG: magnesium chelatase domain-containing protein, partial [Candidatus Puniceispirillaceae bacterium]